MNRVIRASLLSLLLILVWIILFPGIVNSSPRAGEIQADKPAQEHWITFEVTAYTLRVKECGRPPGHPDYGRTASGKIAQVGVAIAAGPEIPLGTKIYLPELRYKNGTGIFIVQDRGGDIGTGCIDIYFGDPIKRPQVVKEALAFGRQRLLGTIIKEVYKGD